MPHLLSVGSPPAGWARHYGEEVITAIVLVDPAVDRIAEAAEKIAEIDQMTEVYPVTGDTDLVAMVRVREHEELAVFAP